MTKTVRRNSPPPPPPPASGGRVSRARANGDVIALSPVRQRRIARVVLVGLVIALVSVAASWAIAQDSGSEVAQVAPAQAAPKADVQPACGAARPEPAGARAYSEAPKMTLKADIDYEAIIYTSCGDMKVDLLEGRAPETVNNFVFLAREGFYDGLMWHQVVHDSIIQTGDPNGLNGTSPDGPGYFIKDELPDARSPYTYGIIGMANAGEADTSGSQFFVVVHDLEGALKGKSNSLEIKPSYTVFAKVKTRFFGSLENIARQPVAGGDNPVLAAMPVAPVYVEAIEIIEKTSKGR